MTYAEQREKEIQKYRNILKHRHLTPEENERFGELVTEEMDEERCPDEVHERLLKNIHETNLCAVRIDAPFGQRPYTKNEFMTMLERKCSRDKSNDE